MTREQLCLNFNKALPIELRFEGTKSTNSLKKFLGGIVSELGLL